MQTFGKRRKHRIKAVAKRIGSSSFSLLWSWMEHKQSTFSSSWLCGDTLIVYLQVNKVDTQLACHFVRRPVQLLNSLTSILSRVFRLDFGERNIFCRHDRCIWKKVRARKNHKSGTWNLRPIRRKRNIRQRLLGRNRWNNLSRAMEPSPNRLMAMP